MRVSFIWYAFSKILFYFRCFSLLTHLFLMHPFSTPWKHQKIVRFSDAFWRQRKGAVGTNGLKRQFIWALFHFLRLMNRPVGTTFSPCLIYKRVPVLASVCITFQHRRALAQLTDILTYWVLYEEDLCWPLRTPALTLLNWGRAYNKMDGVGLFCHNLYF